MGHLRHSAPLLLSCIILLLPIQLAGEEARVLRLFGDAHYPPYTYLNEANEPAGFLVDLIAAMEEETGQRFEVTLHPWHEVPDALRRGEIDGVLGMFHTEEREEVFDFSQPTFVATHSAFVREGSPYHHLEDLRDKAIIVQDMDVMDDYIQAQEFTRTIVRTKDQSMAIRLLAQGEHDAAFLLRIGAWQRIHEHGIDNLRELDAPLMPLDYCIAVAKGDTETLEILDASLQAIRDSGAYDRIRENWFSGYVPQARGFPYVKYFLWLLGAIFGVALLFAAWTVSLRHQVEEKTAALQAELLEREKVTQTLREREQFIRAVLETTPDYVTVYDLDKDCFIYVNKTPPILEERDLEQAADYTQPVLTSLIHPEDRKRVRAHWLRLLKAHDDEVHSIDYRIVNMTQDEDTWLESRDIVFKRHPSGKVQQCLSIVHDITNRKRAHEERQRLEQKIQQTQKLESLGVLAGGIAHDFNNILLAILGNADLALTEMPATDPIRGYVEEIEKASRRAADLCRQMLAYSGKGKFVISDIKLNALLEDMEEMLKISISKKAILQFHLSKSLPSIEGDIAQIRQVVMNLVINASDAIGDQNGTIHVHTGEMHCDRGYLRGVFLDEELPEGDYVYLEVADTGCGMDQATQAKIFDPFYSTKFTGRGLGLAAVMGIVRGHQGALKVYSEPGRGSTFKILLPVARKKTPSHSVKPKKPTQPPKGTGVILLVDDEALIRRMGKRMLEHLGYKVITAQDGWEAVQIFAEQSERIDCVLLDLTMPKMDGTEAYQEMRKLDPAVRCVMSSGYNQQHTTQRLVGVACGFIQKPYTLHELGAVIQEACATDKPAENTPAT